MFDFCVDEYELEAWETLVHVCRRWRNVVFGSPRRLNLRLVCTSSTPARESLDIWPALPLVIRCYGNSPVGRVDNIVAALEHRNRVCQIVLYSVPTSFLEKVLAVIQEPFPYLTRLWLTSDEKAVQVLPNLFLGGSSPRLRDLEFRGIPFPRLPNLLLSATHLVYLTLFDTPHSGYISPEAMITALSMLTSLESLLLKFRSPRSRPDEASRHPPPLTRFILPVLTFFSFKGASEYLDDLVSHIDAPRLDSLYITLFNQITFDTPQFSQFISRTPTLKALEKVDVFFDYGAARITLSSRTSPFGPGGIGIKITCRELDWQVSSLEQVCTSCLPPLSTLEVLYIYGDPKWKPDGQDNIENTLWLELLQPFTAVKNLYISKEFSRRIVPALQGFVGGTATEVLPTLQNIFLEELQTSGPVQEGIRQFIATRQASHSIIISLCQWDRGKAGSR